MRKAMSLAIFIFLAAAVLPSGCGESPGKKTSSGTVRSGRPSAGKGSLKAKVVFVRAENIWSMNTDGTGQKQLTKGGSDACPAISPDGSSIAFLSGGDRYGNPAYPGENTYLDQVYVMDAAGSNARRITRKEDGDCSSMCFSPDGKKLLYDRVVSSNKGNHVDSTEYLSLITIDTGKIKDIDRVTLFEESPWVGNAIDPGGEWDYYAMFTEAGSEVRRENITNLKDEAVLAFEPDSMMHYEPAISPDGKRLACIAHVDDEQGESAVRLAISDISGKNARYYTIGDRTDYKEAEEGYVSWTPDGRLILSDNSSAGDEEVPLRDAYMLDDHGNVLGRIAEHCGWARCGYLQSK